MGLPVTLKTAPVVAGSSPSLAVMCLGVAMPRSVAHEHVVPIFNVEADAPIPYLVMAYIPGMTLEHWIQIHGAPEPAKVLRVSGQLADGLATAHRRGLVDRDIKPGNILVGENIDRVWITDFGLARAADSVTLTRTGVIAGTRHSLSPEQPRGEAIDQRSDCFASAAFFTSLHRNRRCSTPTTLWPC